MKAVSPVVKGFEDLEIIFGKDQPEYLDLPGLKLDGKEGQVITRYKLSFIERLKVLFTGNIWLSLFTFNHPIQPQRIDVNCPPIKRIEKKPLTLVPPSEKKES